MRSFPPSLMMPCSGAGFTRSGATLARDLGPRSITVNSVHPGPIDTDANPQEGPYSEALKKLMATPRYGRPEDVGALVAFLASPQAGFISGTAHHVDNGFTA